MDEGPLFRVAPRRVRPLARPLALLVASVGVFVFGLFAVGAGHLYRGDTWPDYLAMLAASLLILAALVEGDARDRSGAWSWGRLRGSSFLACGLAFVLMLVLSAGVPVEQGVWVEGDSAQGFSVFTFLGSLIVALVAAVKSRGAGVAQLAWDPAVTGIQGGGTKRIVLRRYRFLSRKSYVDVDGTGATIVVPRVFRGRRSWFIPIETIGVVLPDEDAAIEEQPDGADFDADDGEWMTRQEFRTPYLSTTSPFAQPNLTMFFTVPQRIPPIRWSAGGNLDVSPRATRNLPGVLVDGVQLRVVDPETARQVLLASGAQGIADPDSFVQRHRDIVRDPEQVRAVIADARRSFLLLAISGVAALALFITYKATDDERYGFGVAAVLVARWLLDRVMRRRRGA